MRQTHDFHDWVKLRASCQSQLPEHSRHKFWKNFLSVFCDWKFYSRGSRKISRKNLWVPSRLEPPPAKKSPDWAARNVKIPNFEKYSKYFSRLGHWPAIESQKISEWAYDWGMQLDQPTTKSPEQGNTIFEILTIFVKTKYFNKKTKTHKNLFVFDQQG